MNSFTLLKLDRAIWVALLEKEQLLEAIKYYDLYRRALIDFDDSTYALDKKIELDFSISLFQSKILKLADKYLAAKEYDKAVMAYSVAFKNNITNVKCISNYLICLDELKQYDLKLDVLKHLQDISTNNIEIKKLLAQTYEQQKMYSEAINLMEKYIEETGQDVLPEDYNILGCFYNEYYSDVTNKKIDAQKGYIAFTKASDMEPTVKLYAKNATIMAGKINEFEGGKKYWKRVFKTNQLSNDDKFDYAAFCLKTANFSGWHEYFDARFDKENNSTYFPEIKKPKWTGVEDLSESTLLIYCEQGFGDTFLMWGYIPRLLPITKHIIFVSQNEAYDLLKNNDWGVEVYSRDTVDLDKLDFDYYIPTMSIPCVLKLDRSNISVGEGYIKTNPEIVEEFRKQYFDNDKFKIGLSFSGSKTGTHSRDVAIPEFLPFDELENVQLYNLTKDVPDYKFEIFKKNKVINVVKHAYNFADTAAAIENCDIVVTADNCILNLSAAIGKKTFGLFNWASNFRWFDLTGDNIIWYTAVKPYVCNDINNWNSAIIRAIDDIKAIMRNKSA